MSKEIEKAKKPKLTILEQYHTSIEATYQGYWVMILVDIEDFTNVRKKFDIPKSACGFFDSNDADQKIKRVRFLASEAVYNFFLKNFEITNEVVGIDQANANALSKNGAEMKVKKNIKDFMQIAEDINENHFLNKYSCFKDNDELTIIDLLIDKLEPKLEQYLKEYFECDTNGYYSLNVKEVDIMTSWIARFRDQLYVSFLVDKLKSIVETIDVKNDDTITYLEEEKYLELVYKNEEQQVIKTLCNFHQEVYEEELHKFYFSIINFKNKSINDFVIADNERIENERISEVKKQEEIILEAVQKREVELQTFFEQVEEIKLTIKNKTWQKNINNVMNSINKSIISEDGHKLYIPIIEWLETFSYGVGAAKVALADMLVSYLPEKEFILIQSQFKELEIIITSEINEAQKTYNKNKKKNFKIVKEKKETERLMLQSEYLKEAIDYFLTYCDEEYKNNSSSIITVETTDQLQNISNVLYPHKFRMFEIFSLTAERIKIPTLDLKTNIATHSSSEIAEVNIPKEAKIKDRSPQKNKGTDAGKVSDQKSAIDKTSDSQDKQTLTDNVEENKKEGKSSQLPVSNITDDIKTNNMILFEKMYYELFIKGFTKQGLEEVEKAIALINSSTNIEVTVEELKDVYKLADSHYKKHLIEQNLLNNKSLQEFLENFKKIKNTKSFDEIKTIDYIYNIIKPILELEKAHILYEPILKWVETMNNSSAKISMTNLLVETFNLEKCIYLKVEFEIHFMELNKRKFNKNQKKLKNQAKHNNKTLINKYIDDVVKCILEDSFNSSNLTKVIDNSEQTNVGTTKSNNIANEAPYNTSVKDISLDNKIVSTNKSFELFFIAYEAIRKTKDKTMHPNIDLIFTSIKPILMLEIGEGLYPLILNWLEKFNNATAKTKMVDLLVTYMQDPDLNLIKKLAEEKILKFDNEIKELGREIKKAAPGSIKNNFKREEKIMKMDRQSHKDYILEEVVVYILKKYNTNELVDKNKGEENEDQA